MTIIKAKEIEPVFECVQYKHDDPKVTSEITEWLIEHGYPMLFGDPEMPEEMKPADEEKDGPGDKGFYVDPLANRLVVRAWNMDHFVEDDEWLVLHPNEAIGIFADELFPKRFVVVED